MKTKGVSEEFRRSGLRVPGTVSLIADEILISKPGVPLVHFVINSFLLVDLLSPVQGITFSPCPSSLSRRCRRLDLLPPVVPDTAATTSGTRVPLCRGHKAGG